MHEFIERRDGVWWVANPVQPEENFAVEHTSGETSQVLRLVGQCPV
jgi:hypothetical protein